MRRRPVVAPRSGLRRRASLTRGPRGTPPPVYTSPDRRPDRRARRLDVALRRPAAPAARAGRRRGTSGCPAAGRRRARRTPSAAGRGRRAGRRRAGPARAARAPAAGRRARRSPRAPRSAASSGTPSTMPEPGGGDVDERDARLRQHLGRRQVAELLLHPAGELRELGLLGLGRLTLRHVSPPAPRRPSSTDSRVSRTCSANASSSVAPCSSRRIARCAQLPSSSIRSIGARNGSSPSARASGAASSSSPRMRSAAGTERMRVEIDQLARDAVADRPPLVLLEHAARRDARRLALVDRAQRARRHQVAEGRRARSPRARRVRRRRCAARSCRTTGAAARTTRSACARGSSRCRAGSGRTRRSRAQPSNGSGMPQRGNMRVKCCERVECRCVMRPSVHGELALSASRSGRIERSRFVSVDRALVALHADVHVDAERVVAPGDVAQRLLDEPVVRRVDDRLVLPARPRVRAGRAELDAEPVGEPVELAPALDGEPRRLGEPLAAAGLDLDLALDQLARQVLLERRALGQRLELAKAVAQGQRLAVEDLELLLDRKREVGGGVEAGTCLRKRAVGVRTEAPIGAPTIAERLPEARERVAENGVILRARAADECSPPSKRST